jgi:hypothetical protein
MKTDFRSYGNEYSYIVGDYYLSIGLWKVPVGTDQKILIAFKKNGLVYTTNSYNPNDDLEALNDFYRFEEEES